MRGLVTRLGWWAVAVPLTRFLVGVWVLLGPLPVWAAGEVPIRKAGLWVITLQTARAPEQTVRHCIDASTDRQMLRFVQGAELGQCTRNHWRREGDRYLGEAHCQFGQTAATIHSALVGNFSREYRGEIRTRYVPALAGVAQSRVTLTARWSGECPAGWKPGDMQTPGMGRVHVDELKATRGLGRAAATKRP